MGDNDPSRGPVPALQPDVSAPLGEADPSGRWSEALRIAGKAGANAGRVAARSIALWYRSVDPDVPRHLLQIPLLSYTLLSPRQAEIVAGEDDGHPPLIFVHGLGGGRGDFLAMSWYLRLGGRKRSYRIGFEKGHGIARMAEALAAFVREVQAKTGARQVDIVAHSLGGLIVRCAIHDEGLGEALRTVITLGTPHGGTHAARLGNTPTTRDLRPDSELLSRLRQRGWPRSVRCVSFWSPNDLFILPAESAKLEGAEAVEMPQFTHYSYLLAPRSWVAVECALRNAGG